MGAPATRGGPGAVFLAVAAAVLTVDQSAKAAARGGLGPEAPFSLLGNWVRLKLTHNTGSAFGVVSEGWVLVAVGVVVCVAIVAYVTVGRGLAGERGRAVPLGLVLGGSLGNLLDRIRSGGVTDFIDLRVWPVFNLADVAITVGIALLAIRLVRRR